MFQLLVKAFIAGILTISATVAGWFIPAPEPVNLTPLEIEISMLEQQLDELLELGGVRFVAGERYRIAGGGISSSATSITLQSFQTLDGRELVMATHFGDTGWLTLEPGTSKKELISFTAISQSGSSDEATLSGVTRGLDFVYPYTASTTLAQAHSGGALVIISNPPQLYNSAAFKANDETITGDWTFTSTATAQYDAGPSFTVDNELITKKYADDLAIAGAADANLTTKGLVEIATRSDLIASAAASSSDTTAYLVVPTSYFATTTSATTSVPVTNSSGKLSQGFLDLTADFAFTGAVSIATSSSADVFSLIPAGVIQMYATTTAPSGWLLCDGTAYSTSTYPNLFSIVGYNYGGNGTSTFATPNIEGRNVIGYGSSTPALGTTTPTTDTMGKTGGEQSHTQTEAEIAAHTHTVPYSDNDTAATAGNTIYGHVATANANKTSSSTGSGNAFNVLDPYIVLNYIIKY